jgi:hypothetical protein
MNGTREIPAYLPRSSSVEVASGAGNEWNVMCACVIPTGVRGVDGRSRAEPTQNVKRCADHRPCQAAELCAAAHRGRPCREWANYVLGWRAGDRRARAGARPDNQLYVHRQAKTPRGVGFSGRQSPATYVHWEAGRTLVAARDGPRRRQRHADARTTSPRPGGLIYLASATPAACWQPNTDPDSWLAFGE